MCSFYVYSGDFSDAIKSGDKEKITLLIRQGKNINAIEFDGSAEGGEGGEGAEGAEGGEGVYEEGNFPLVVAVRHGSIDMILHLLQSGADPNACSFLKVFDGCRLYRTVILETESIEIIFLLLIYGADPSVGISNGNNHEYDSIYSFAVDYLLYNHYFTFFYWFLLPGSIRDELKQKVKNPQELNKVLFDLFPMLTITSLVTVLSTASELKLSSFPHSFRAAFGVMLRPFLYEESHISSESLSSSSTESWDE